jgi:hypothetical protein
LAPNDAAIEVREGSGDVGSGVLVGELAPERSGDRDAMESGRRRLPDCGRRWFHESVPERPKAAALATGFFGSVSSSVVGAGGLVRRCSVSSRAVSDGGLMKGVGVLAALSCMSRGVPAAERIDCGVLGLSGEMDRARSGYKTSTPAMQGLAITARLRVRTGSAR